MCAYSATKHNISCLLNSTFILFIFYKEIKLYANVAIGIELVRNTIKYFKYLKSMPFRGISKILLSTNPKFCIFAVGYPSAYRVIVWMQPYWLGCSKENPFTVIHLLVQFVQWMRNESRQHVVSIFIGNIFLCISKHSDLRPCTRLHRWNSMATLPAIERCTQVFDIPANRWDANRETILCTRMRLFVSRAHFLSMANAIHTDESHVFGHQRSVTIHSIYLSTNAPRHISMFTNYIYTFLSLVSCDSTDEMIVNLTSTLMPWWTRFHVHAPVHNWLWKSGRI